MIFSLLVKSNKNRKKAIGGALLALLAITSVGAGTGVALSPSSATATANQTTQKDGSTTEGIINS